MWLLNVERGKLKGAGVLEPLRKAGGGWLKRLDRELIKQTTSPTNAHT